MPFNCPFCPKVVTLTRHINAHLIVHTGEKPFECSTCGKEFNNTTNLKQHISSQHEPEILRCKYSDCKRVFPSKSALSRHYRHRKDKVNRPYKCNYCCDRCKSPTGHTQHLKKIHKLNKDGTKIKRKSTSKKMGPPAKSLKKTKRKTKTQANTSMPKLKCILQVPNSQKVDGSNNMEETNQRKRPRIDNDGIDSDEDEVNTVGQSQPVTDADDNQAVDTNANSQDEASLSAHDDKDLFSEDIDSPTHENDDDHSQEIFYPTQYQPGHLTHTTGMDTQEQDSSDEENVQTNKSTEEPIDMATNKENSALLLEVVPEVSTSQPKIATCILPPTNKQASPTVNIPEVTTDNLNQGNSLSLYDKLVLKSWGVTSNWINGVKIRARIYKINSKLWKFMNGETPQMTIIELMQILNDQDPVVGKFIKSLLIIEFVRKLEVTELQGIYSIKTQLKDYEQFIENVTDWYLKFTIHTATSKKEATEKIHDKLSEMVEDENDEALDFVTYALNLIEESSKVLMPNDCILRISNHLNDVILKDIKAKEEMGDNDAPMLDRMTSWTCLKETYVNSLDKVQTKSIYHVLIKSNLERRIGTEIGFYKGTNDESNAVHIHQEMIEKVVKQRTLKPPIIENLLQKDVETFIDILYDRKQHPTLQTLRIAQAINIDDPLKFLFTDDPLVDISPQSFIDLLQILIALKNLDLLGKMVKHEQWLNVNHQKYKAVIGLKHEELKFFVEQTIFKTDTLDLFKIIVRWAAHKTNQKCEDELRIIPTTETMEVFNSVRQLIPIGELLKYHEEIKLQNFIPRIEILRENLKTRNKKRMEESATGRDQDH